MKCQNKLIKSILVFYSLISLITLNCHAENLTIEPIFTKSAQIYSDITIDTEVGYYNDRELEEIENLDAYEVLFDITVPVSQNAQLRLTVPAYTDGDGKIKDTGSSLDGKSVDVDGDGGTYEFLTLSLEYQFMNVTNHGYNLLAYGGYGARTAYLDTSHGDKLNHKGELAKLGLRYDAPMSDYDSNLFATLEYRHYWDTDDINPANDNSTSFNIVNVSGAWVWKRDSSFYPVVELKYSTDIDDYHAFSVVPELIYNINPAIDIKLGLPVGISDDADKYGVRLGLTTRF